jgi:large subunit ribosomal protein L29
MKAKELREKSSEELEALVGELGRTLWKSRFDNHTNQLDNTAKIPGLRRDVARAKTILSERKRKA